LFFACNIEKTSFPHRFIQKKRSVYPHFQHGFPPKTAKKPLFLKIFHILDIYIVKKAYFGFPPHVENFISSSFQNKL